MLRTKLEKLLPPGFDLEAELKWIAWGLGLSFFYSLGFLFRYGSAISALYYYDGNYNKILNEQSYMRPFSQLFGSTTSGFLLVAICMIGLAAYHYAYHYQGSKSIYLMRRLPDRLDLWRRCLTLPLLAILVCAVCVSILTAIYYAVYLGFTPKMYLVRESFSSLIRTALGV